jgi:hypothetical protein
MDERALLASVISWSLLAFLLVTVVVAFRDRKALSGFWLTTEDPRTMGAFRIAFAGLLILDNFTVLPYVEFLFSNEGMLRTQDALAILSDPESAQAESPLRTLVLRHHLHSWLWFLDSPISVWVAFWALQCATLSLLLGYRTRTSAIIAYLLLLNLWTRNWAWQEGTENVFTVFFFYMLFCRSGHAYSIDEWLRRRREGQSTTPYRSIPTWPRKLMMLQLAMLYATSGVLKHGETWVSGEAVYYAVNLDHFSRFYPQAPSAWLGPTPFKLLTWSARWIEVLFPLAFIGVFARAGLQGLPGPRVRIMVSWVLGRRVWLTLAVALQLGIALVMNIGVFQWIMIACTMLYLEGGEVGRALGWVRKRLGFGRPPIPAASPTAPAYGPRGRTLVSVLLAWQVAAITVWLMPGQRLLSPWLPAAREVFGPWLRVTHTDQYWGMFGGGPPQENWFLMALVTDADGEVWDMRTDLYAPERFIVPTWRYDRFRKLSRVISVGEAGAGDTFPPFFARWVCREWTRSYDGILPPQQVELILLSYAIPPLEQVQTLGPYDPHDLLARSGTRESIHVERCAAATN